MNFENIYTELKKCGTEENRKIYISHGAKGDIFGVSLADLQRLKKDIISTDGKIGINHKLAQKLWNTRNMDARVLACMISDPLKITRNEANKWVSDINYYALADHFADLIAETRFGQDIMYLWIQSPAEYIKRVGFAIIDNFARHDNSKSNLFFNAFLQKIKQEIQFSPNRAKEAMNNCLIAIAGRNEALRDKVLDIARAIGPIEIDLEKNSHKTFIIEESINKMWKQKKHK